MTTKKSDVTMAWDLITLLGLNEEVSIGAHSAQRFSLVGNKGHARKTPAAGLAVYDMLEGKWFLPQTDALWLDQLMTRFRVSAIWDEVAQSWVAHVGQHHDPLVSGRGATPGFAVVEALVTAAKLGLATPKQPF